MISFVADNELLARGLSNALAFIPANSRYVNVWIRVNAEARTLEIMGTDSYAAGLATVPFDSYQGPPEGAEILVHKGKADTKTAEGAAGLERTVRMAGKGPCRVVMAEGAVTVEPMGGDTLVALMAYAPELFSAYQGLADIMTIAEKRPEAVPGVICLDPALWSRFSKVKADKGQRMADLLFGDSPLDPVLVKIGPDFRGLLMPIDREVNGKNIGEDGLW
ncbi:hypothetical protein [Micromonospora coerulea]|uniref:hypothetical protein n=1 Tax=Micromonospora coerulea TaxID=47856 RepID=UPI0019051E7C|nr:hypothetical protein [Micromonospora veneta]